MHLHLVTLGVADVARSRRFYETLGFKASSARQEAVTFLKAGGVCLALFGREALADDAGVPNAGSGFAGISLAHNVATKEAVAELLAQAVAAGAKLVRPAEDVFWGGHRGYFTDPDGHLWEVAWNPFFPFDDSGALALP